MGDSYVELNPGTGGAVMDEERVEGFGSGPAARLRSRIVLGGSSPAELARVRNVTPADDDYGVVVRAIDSISTDTAITVVAATTSPVTLGSNPETRLAMTVYNEPGASVMFLKFGDNVTVNSYSNRLGPGDYWESTPPRYTGPVTAVWDGTTGRALITEFLP